MSTAIRIFQGRFGRVALLDMDKPLVVHAHHHCHALIKVRGDDTFFAVRDRLQPLTGDSVVLVNAWEPHAYAHQDPLTQRTIILALYIEPDWLGDIQQALCVSGHPRFFPQSCVELPPYARKLADELATEMLMAEFIDPARLEEKLFELLITVIDHNSEWRNFSALMRTMRRHTEDARVRRAIAMMRENVGTELDIGRLAADAGMSRAHFFAMFRRCTNLTPAVYANVLRMEAAIRGLTSSQSPIGEISYAMGFSAPPHFTRFFRQHLGVTPGEYRRVVDVVASHAA